MKAWRGQNNAGGPINVIYYGLWGWPSFSVMFVPGTEGYDDDVEKVLVRAPRSPVRDDNT